MTSHIKFLGIFRPFFPNSLTAGAALTGLWLSGGSSTDKAPSWQCVQCRKVTQKLQTLPSGHCYNSYNSSDHALGCLSSLPPSDQPPSCSNVAGLDDKLHSLARFNQMLRA